MPKLDTINNEYLPRTETAQKQQAPTDAIVNEKWT
jgi:hypothetical protein